MALQQAGKLLGREWGTEEVALHAVAAVALQIVELALGLRPFGHHAQLEVMGHGDDRGGDHGIVRVGGDVLNEGAVNLHGIDGEALQVAEAGETGAKIVQGDPDPQGPHRPQHFDGLLGAIHHDGLGNLEIQQMGGEARVGQGLGHQGVDRLVAKLARGEIDAHGDLRQTRLAPALGLLTGLAQHPLADGQNHARLLRLRNELHGWHQAAIGITPAQQRLGADHATALQIHLRLVEELELLGIQGAAQRPLEAHGTAELIIKLGIVELIVVSADILGAVHGQGGIFKQIADPVAVIGIEGDAKAGAKLDALSREVKGVAEGAAKPVCLGGNLVAPRLPPEQNNELIAALAANGVVLAQLMAQAQGDGAQQLVAGVMAEPFIDGFELIQPQRDDRDFLLLAVCLHQGLAQAVLEQGAVGQFGERIMGGHVAQALFLRQTLGDIVHDADEVGHHPLLIGHRGDLQIGPEGLARVAAAADEHLLLTLFGNGRVQILQGLLILRLMAEHGPVVLADGVQPVPGQLFKAAIDIDDGVLRQGRVGDEDGAVAGIQRAIEGAHLIMGQFARGDVLPGGHIAGDFPLLRADGGNHHGFPHIVARLGAVLDHAMPLPPGAKGAPHGLIELGVGATRLKQSRRGTEDLLLRITGEPTDGAIGVLNHPLGISHEHRYGALLHRLGEQLQAPVDMMAFDQPRQGVGDGLKKVGLLRAMLVLG